MGYRAVRDRSLFTLNAPGPFEMCFFPIPESGLASLDTPRYTPTNKFAGDPTLVFDKEWGNGALPPEYALQLFFEEI